MSDWPDMHAVGADLHRDLHTVVDDEGDAVAGGEGLEFLCLREKGSLVKLLFAKLQKVAPAASTRSTSGTKGRPLSQLRSVMA